MPTIQNEAMLMTQYDTVTVLTAQVDEKIDEIMPCTSPVSAASTRNPLWNGMRRLSSRGLHTYSETLQQGAQTPTPSKSLSL
jgi:hypothetical protein